MSRLGGSRGYPFLSRVFAGGKEVEKGESLGIVVSVVSVK